MSNETADLLRRAKERIINPENWTVERAARASDGHPVDSYSSEAVCWCSMGALAAENGRLDHVWSDAITFLQDVCGDEVGHFNDTHTHDEVLTKFDEAIALAKQK